MRTPRCDAAYHGLTLTPDRPAVVHEHWVRKIVPITVVVLSWIGGAALLTISGALLVAMLLPMSPFIAIIVAWDARGPVVRWWGKQFARGMRIIFPNPSVTTVPTAGTTQSTGANRSKN